MEIILSNLWETKFCSGDFLHRMGLELRASLVESEDNSRSYIMVNPCSYDLNLQFIQAQLLYLSISSQGCLAGDVNYRQAE